MNPDERRLFERLDRMILDASPDELKKIQEADLQTQLHGLPFYDTCINSKYLESQSIRQKSRKQKL